MIMTNGVRLKPDFQLKVLKTPRCSGQKELAADGLSKGDWEGIWQLMPKKDKDPSKNPRVLLSWIRNPIPDMKVGERVLAEMSRYTKVLYLAEGGEK